MQTTNDGLLSSRLEIASEGYKNYFKSTVSNALQNEKQTINPANLSTNVAKFHLEKTFDCYFELHDWENFVEWHREYKEAIVDKFEGENFIHQGFVVVRSA